MMPSMLQQYDDARKFLREHMLGAYGLDGNGVHAILALLKYFTNQMVAIVDEKRKGYDDDNQTA